MALYTPVSTLLTMLKAEIGSSLTAGVSSADDAALRVLLSNKQKFLAYQYNFPDLELKVTQTVTAGTRYGTFPVTLDLNRPVLMETKWTTYWRELEYGIDAQEFMFYDSDLGRAADPIRKWLLHGVDGSGNRTYEVWPIPASDVQVRFTGQIPIATLSADSDKAQLDDLMLVLFVAADRLMRTNQTDARAKATQAEQIAISLSRTLPDRQPVFSLTQNRGAQRPPRLTYIRAGH